MPRLQRLLPWLQMRLGMMGCMLGHARGPRINALLFVLGSFFCVARQSSSDLSFCAKDMHWGQVVVTRNQGLPPPQRV